MRTGDHSVRRVGGRAAFWEGMGFFFARRFGGPNRLEHGSGAFLAGFIGLVVIQACA